MCPKDRECTANCEPTGSIGRVCLTYLKDKGLNIGTVTTDSDTSVLLAAEDLYKSGVTKTKPNHQLRHQTRNIESEVSY